MEKSASNVIVKSSNSDESGNDPCKTRRERPGLLRGNQGKAQTIQVAGFHRRLASTNLFLSSSALSRPLFFLLPPFFAPPPSFPLLTSTLSLFEHSALFIVSVSFQAFRTVYKVEALNWKPQLCRRYCGFFFPPFRFRPVCCLSLLSFFILRLHLCSFCSCGVRGPLLFASSREGSS